MVNYRLIELEKQLKCAKNRLDNMSLPFGAHGNRYETICRTIRELEHEIYVIKAGKK